MHFSLSINDVVNKLLGFYGKFCGQIGFINYLKDQWEPQISQYKSIIVIHCWL
jgi:hypothetical protein